MDTTHNDRTHDSTVATGGKNREAARLAGHGPIAADEVIGSDATLDNSVAEARDGFAGFDSRPGGNHLMLAVLPGYRVIDRGMIDPDVGAVREHWFDSPDPLDDADARGRIHYALNHVRPARIIELQRVK
ncbi:DUF3005 domain-containing protein [Paraburkholderia sp.]|uniref:DUF3005 domain-containing protein n=1 Tax=Paraburkholderia sp. TaxID=1926495 RepID=UPI003D6F3DB2